MDGHVGAARVLDAPQVQDLGAAGGHLKHLVMGDAVDLVGLRDDPRVGGEDAVHVGVDLADIGLEGGRERHRGGVGAATAEGCDLLRALADALEAGHDDDVLLAQGLSDAAGRDIDDLGLAVRGVGDDPGLAAGEGPHAVPQVRDGHRDEGHRHALTGGQEHVHLAWGRDGADLLSEIEQLVGCVPHGRDHDAYVVACLLRLDDAMGHALDALGISERRTAVLLDNQAQGELRELFAGPARGRTGTTP